MYILFVLCIFYYYPVATSFSDIACLTATAVLACNLLHLKCIHWSYSSTLSPLVIILLQTTTDRAIGVLFDEKISPFSEELKLGPLQSLTLLGSHVVFTSISLFYQLF